MKNKKKILAVALCAAALAVLVLGAVAFARREDEKSIADAGVATLIQRVREHNLLVQVNGSYFLNPKTVRQAIWHLQNGEIQLIGSDCHNLTSRAPNLGAVWQQVKAHHAEDAFKLLRHNAAQLLSRRRM